MNEECHFCKGDWCSALKVAQCPRKCTFFKTTNQYFFDQMDASDRLTAKGLKPAIIDGIMTVEAIPTAGAEHENNNTN